jgi:UDP-GlcNAc:undecaprenyl-phosphate GlcNAc-1-phosphate transferase
VTNFDFSISQKLGDQALSRKQIACLVFLLFVIPQGWISAWAWEQDLRGLYLILISFFFSTLLVPFAIYLAIRFMILDMPSDRKMHTAATPRLGGLAVYGATMLTLLRNDQWDSELMALAAGGTLIFMLGVYDDAKGLSARIRLIGQLAAAAIVIAGGVCVDFFSHIPGKHALDAALTAFGIIGITNAVNFLDGIDGLAGGMGALCSALFLAIAWPVKQKHLAYASSALCGSCLGFLPFNWQPARVFLGDGGATFIGFMLAGLGVLCTRSDAQLPIVRAATPIIILSIPIFDMIYTTLSRIRRGAVHNFREWIEYTGRDHFHHRLMKLGLSAPGAVKFILLLNLCIGLNAVANRFTSRRIISALLLSQTALIFAIVVVLMLLGRELTGQHDDESAPRRENASL